MNKVNNLRTVVPFQTCKCYHPKAVDQANHTNQIFSLKLNNSKLNSRIVSTRVQGKDPQGLDKLGDTQEGTSSHDAQLDLHQDQKYDNRREGSLATYLKFYLPALTLPIADPLMSLIDTICIGKYASTAEIAALSPATLLLTSLQYIVISLSMATTQQVSRLSATGQKDKVQTLVQQAMGTAIVAGVAGTVIYQIFSGPLIALIQPDQQIVQAGIGYVKLRAVGLVTVYCAMVAQGALVGSQDAFTPCVAVVTQSIINLILDYIFIKEFSMGLTGAALGTVLAQCVGTFLIVRALIVRRILKKFSFQFNKMQSLMGTTGPLTFAYTCRTLAYFLLFTYASTLPILQLATHSVVYSVYHFLSFLSVPVETIAVAFLPSAHTVSSFKRVVRDLVMMAFGIGVVEVLSCALCVVRNPQWVVQDVRLWGGMGSVAFPVCLTLMLASMDVATTGILVAQAKFKRILQMYSVSLLVISLWSIACVTWFWGVKGVWWGLVLFFVMRGSLTGLLVATFDVKREAQSNAGGAPVVA